MEIHTPRLTYLKRALVLFCCLASLAGIAQPERDSIELILKRISKTGNEEQKLENISSLFDYEHYTTNDTLLKYALLGISLAEKSKQVSHQAQFNLNIARIHYTEGYYDKAIDRCITALNLAESTDNKKLKSKIHNSMGILYSEVKKFDKALEHYNIVLQLKKELNDSAGMGSAYLNLGTYYEWKKDWKTAEAHYQKALTMFEKTGDHYGHALATNNIGLIRGDLGDYANALIYFKKSLALKSMINDQYGLAEGYLNYGDALGFVNKRDLAIKNYDLALLYADSAKADLLKRDIYYSLSGAYEKLKNPVLAFEYFRKYTALKDTLMTRESLETIHEMQTKYESDKKDQELLVKDAEIKRQETDASKKRVQRNAFLSGFVLMLVLAFFIYRSYRQKKAANEIISLQKQEVEYAKEIIEKQKGEVEEKQKEILDSIHYAKRIQNTLLAHADFLNANIPGNFVLFKPKDIVSGDFYWATKKDHLFYVAVCDSTGHGVPGAFMSLLNIGFLSEAINEKDILEPNKVFDYVRERLVNTISKEGQQDGFDGILFCIDKKKKRITYSAAHNAPLVVGESETRYLEADKMPVGKGVSNEAFRLFELELKDKDTLYLYTDGYADQFGGPKGKKFLYKKLNELIASVAGLPLQQQKEKLDVAFSDWKGDLEQVDDVLLIGIKI